MRKYWHPKTQVVANSMLHSDKTGNIHCGTWNLPIAVAKGMQVVSVFIQQSAAPQAYFLAFDLLWLVWGKMVSWGKGYFTDHLVKWKIWY